MAKRSWDEAAGASAQPGAGRLSLLDAAMLPNITRKVKACAACRKQKMKCIMTDDEPPCVRCKQRGLSCVLNKSLQSLVEDTRQIEALQADIVGMHATLDLVCRHLDIASPSALQTAAKAPARPEAPTSEGDSVLDDDREVNICEVSPPTSPSAVQAPIDTFLDIAKLGSPGSGNAESAPTRKRAGRPDIVSKGIISLATAERLAERYFSRLDHFLYGIASSYNSLQALRKASPFLLAAVCTVSALHEPGDRATYEACNEEFRSLVSRAMFEKRDLEFLRALCIGSFWLSDASRILSSDAIRRAADMRLHKHFYHITGSNPHAQDRSSQMSIHEQIDRVRLWYLLYVCDQHLSVLHNRAPVLTGIQDLVVNWELYLEGNERYVAAESDIRILSQVSLLLIMSQVREILGSETGEPVPRYLLDQINSYKRRLEQWFSKFYPRFMRNDHVGDFPVKGLQMHFQFGKLYLGHHVFRGLQSNPIPAYFLPTATMAHEAAVAIFESLIHDEDLQASLLGIPHYFHIMIAFAGHFLLNVSTKYAHQLGVDPRINIDLIGRVLSHLRSIPCIPQHPIYRMAAGLSTVLLSLATNGLPDPMSAGYGDLIQSAAQASTSPGQLRTFSMPQTVPDLDTETVSDVSLHQANAPFDTPFFDLNEFNLTDMPFPLEPA